MNILKSALKGIRNIFIRAKNLDEIEEALIESDVGVELTDKILKECGEDKDCIRRKLLVELKEVEAELTLVSKPTVILVFGVNGSGKTTTVAKLAKYFKAYRPLIVSADTFRDAANEQLSEWAKKVGVDILRSIKGQDPASVVYDGLEKAMKKGYNPVIVDTAGRLHTRRDLMGEIVKINKVSEKILKRKPDYSIMILDASTGRSGLGQAKEFKKIANLTGLIISKMDGTAKAGVVFSIHRELGLKVYFIGTGESEEDLFKFNKERFIEAIMG